MELKHHKTLNIDKWRIFSFGKQILMIGSELNRANNWIIKKDFQEVKLCYERALELLYLTIACAKRVTQVHELCRFKEMLAGLYAEKSPSIEKNRQLYSVLITLSQESYVLLHK